MSLLQRIGVLLIVLSMMLIGAIYYINSEISVKTQPFSSYTVLSSSWEKFKGLFINHDGRVIDYSQNAVTTSDAQGFAMLRAVWVDDKATFDTLWNWTRVNLQHHTDMLFGWEWGKNTDGKYGFINGGGEKNHTSADTNIALALILASARWKDPSYRDQALPILTSIWQYDTAIQGKTRYILPGFWAKNERTLIIDPASFPPYAFRVFATVDKKHDWGNLINQSYDFLDELSKSPLDKKHSVGLPPSNILLIRSTGTIEASNSSELTTAYTESTYPLAFNVALDYQWSHDKRAKEYLITAFSYLTATYKTTHQLAGSYAHDGTILRHDEDPIMYATFLGVLQNTDSTLAKKLYEEKVIRLYHNDENTFLQSLPSETQSWLWLSTALYNNNLSSFGLLKKEQ